MISQQPKFLVTQNMFTANSNRFANDAISVEPSEMTVFSNQALAGSAHPRTKIQPIIAAPSYDYGFWNKGGQLSIINSSKKQYPKQMGFSRRDFLNYEPTEGEKRAAAACTAAPVPLPLYNPLAETLQPSVYTVPSEFQAINYNLGISTTPHFNRQYELKMGDNTLFTPLFPVEQETVEKFAYTDLEQDQQPKTEAGQPSSSGQKPRTVEASHVDPDGAAPHEIDDVPNIYNVYDPRFNSYGPSNRCYIDPNVQQSRWFYDDVNSLRMPNYIVRSKIDSCLTPAGDTIGTLNAGQTSLSDVKRKVEKNYLDNNLDHRNSIMESVMRKRNAEMWQLRQSPLIRYPQNARR